MWDNSWDMRLPHSVCDAGQWFVTGGPGNNHCGDDVTHEIWGWIDGDASLEVLGIITAVMRLNEIFEWIAWRYGVLNGLQADTDMVWIWIWLREVVKNYSIPLLGSRWDDAIFYYQKELRIWDMGMMWRNPGSGFCAFCLHCLWNIRNNLQKQHKSSLL